MPPAKDAEDVAGVSGTAPKSGFPMRLGVADVGFAASPIPSAIVAGIGHFKTVDLGST